MSGNDGRLSPPFSKVRFTIRSKDCPLMSRVGEPLALIHDYMNPSYAIACVVLESLDGRYATIMDTVCDVLSWTLGRNRGELGQRELGISKRWFDDDTVEELEGRGTY